MSFATPTEHAELTAETVPSHLDFTTRTAAITPRPTRRREGGRGGRLRAPSQCGGVRRAATTGGASLERLPREVLLPWRRIRGGDSALGCGGDSGGWGLTAGSPYLTRT
ncbi:hypothetical protein JCM18899A_25170 [Nocardioides sp. AN3]